MTDFTHSRNRRSFTRRASRASLTILVVALAAGWSPAAAFADGDPASDVLAQQSLFLPQDAGLTTAQQAQLAALVHAAAHSGYPLRVALIASSADLGSVAELWNQPQSYAKFLGQELALIYRGPLLVIMPAGIGLHSSMGPITAARSALANLRGHPPGAGLGTVALTAIQHVTAAAGHPLSIPPPTAPAKPGSTDTTPWIVFAAGVVLIAVAWAASLRASPPHPRPGRSASA